MFVTAQKGILPKSFAKVNKNGVPVALVISQLAITTIALTILTNTGGGSNMSFLIALSLTVVIYLCSYFMLFLGYIQLIRKQPEKKRAFHIPGGKNFKILIAVVGLVISILAFIVSFFPPSSLPGGEANDVYVELLVVSFLIVLSIPFIVYALHTKKGKTTNATLVPIKSHNAPEGHFFMHPRARSTHHFVVGSEKKIDSK